MNKGIFLILFASGALLLTGCSNNAQTGAVIGSLVGAGIGKSTSNHRDKRAVVGAVLGGLVGAAIGQDKDAKDAAARGYNTSSTTATTTPYSNGTLDHTHGNRSHSHDGAAGNHSHNGGATASNNTQHTVQREVVYVERPYYPVRSSVIFSSGYNHYPRRHYRHNRHYRHHNRHSSRHHNRHNNRHHYKRRY
ncbi:MAG: YMGG-like glycine zipper-containing protein [Cocleimonas sp.]